MAGKLSVRYALSRDGPPSSSGKNRAEAPEGHCEVRVQGDDARITAIMSGTTILQQGLTTTCKDSRISFVESDGRSLVGRMSP